MHKRHDYRSDLNFAGGQIAQDGTLLLIETEEQELDFFERPVPKCSWTITLVRDNSIETVELKNIPLMPTHADLFSDGTLLIVQGRCLKDGT